MTTSSMYRLLQVFVNPTNLETAEVSMSIMPSFGSRPMLRCDCSPHYPSRPCMHIEYVENRWGPNGYSAPIDVAKVPPSFDVLAKLAQSSPEEWRMWVLENVNPVTIRW